MPRTPSPPPDATGSHDFRYSVGSTFGTAEEAAEALLLALDDTDYQFKRGRSERDPNTLQMTRLTFPCASAGKREISRGKDVDPEDWRASKSKRTGCPALVTVRRNLKEHNYLVVKLDLQHNHPKTGRRAVKVTEQHIEAQSGLGSSLTAATARAILQKSSPVDRLGIRQVSNLISRVRTDERRLSDPQDVGDAAALLSHLEELKDKNPAWRYKIKADPTTGRLQAVFWMTPVQVQLAQKYWKVLLNDMTQGTNKYRFALNVFLVIDGNKTSRISGQCFSFSESMESHEWMLDQYLSACIETPEVLISDQDIGLTLAVNRIAGLEATVHRLCSRHIHTNLRDNLRSRLAGTYETFLHDFIRLENACSPTHFELLSQQILDTYPAGREYLSEHPLRVKDQWALHTTCRVFTAGTTTTNHVEAENRHLKSYGSASHTLMEAFTALNCRINRQEQSSAESLRTDGRQRSRSSPTELLFSSALAIIRRFGCPHAVQHSYSQMELTMLYACQAVPIHQIEEERQYDQNQLDLKWLNSQAGARGKTLSALYEVTKRSSGSTQRARHLLAWYTDGSYLDTCMEGTTHGLPCRHFWAVWNTELEQPIVFSPALINTHWWSDLTRRIAPQDVITRRGPIRDGVYVDNDIASSSRAGLATPLASSPDGKSRAVKNDPRRFFCAVSSKAKEIIATVRTKEEEAEVLAQMDLLKSKLAARDDKSTLSREASAIRDPIPVQGKGRPRQKRLHNHSEGPEGVSKKQKGNKCSRCGAVGHNKVTCKSEGHQATAGSSPAETSAVPVKKVAWDSPLAEVKTFKRGGSIGSYIEESS